MIVHYSSNLQLAGVDEAGRGPLAGPVVAAAVILPKGIQIEGLDDSKKLSEKKRMELRIQILETALAWGIGFASPKEIDKINILQATYLAMHRAIEKLNPIPEFLLIDGNRFKAYKDLPYSCEIKGDGRFYSIAAASILAKTERDMEMVKLHKKFPLYGWNKNKGYPTIQHRTALMEQGPSPHHRKSFKVKPVQLQIF